MPQVLVRICGLYAFSWQLCILLLYSISLLSTIIKSERLVNFKAAPLRASIWGLVFNQENIVYYKKGFYHAMYSLRFIIP